MLVGALALAAPAAAHASLLFTTPAAGAAVPASPTAITLVFDEHVTLATTPLRLRAASDRAVSLASPQLSNGGSTLSAAVRGRLPDGVYTVDWQVVSDDGDGVTGSYQFAVGAAATGPLATGATSSASRAQWQTAFARWLQIIALAVLLGEATLRRRDRARPSAATPIRLAAGLGALTSILLLRLTAGDGSVLTPLTSQAAHALSSKPGAIAITEAAAFIVALLVAIRRPRWAWLPASAVLVAEAVRAHPANYLPGLGEILTAVHLTAAALWVGTLLLAARHAVTQLRTGKPAWLGVASYARLAAWLLALVLISGILSALVVLPLSNLDSRYGITLLIKLGLVAATLAAAITGRMRLTHKVRTGRGRAPVHVMGVEAGLLVAVLAVTAVLTTTAPPRLATTSLPIAPAAVGPVLYLGDRTGWIGITLAASAGQAVIHLFPPGADEPDEAAKTHPRLAASLTAPGHRPQPLQLRGCGGGCFVARAAWAAGSNRLTLHAAATGWKGGTVTLTVPWPPRPDPRALARLAATLRHTGIMTDYERVTSDTTTGPGAIQAIPLTGPRFLATEPYSNGRASAVDTVQHSDGTSEILIGYPSQNIYARLQLDQQGRPIRETLTDPDHLITRSFTYPEKH